MAEYLIKDTTLQSIADAIKEKTGNSDPIPVTEMAEAIGAIATPEGEKKTINLDFSNGDMIVVPDDGKVFGQIYIPKPENFESYNIAKNVNIAGLTGTFDGGSIGDFDTLDPNLAYFVYQIDTIKKTVAIFAILGEVIYEKTGSYDVTIPDTLGGYNVLLRTEGV